MLLIRSQDKKKLVNFSQVTDLSVVKLTDGFGVNVYFAFSVNNDYASMCIGEYSTEEIAIGVLNMIQDKFQEPVYQNGIGDNEVAIYKNTVFQMPKNEDLEE